MEVSLVQDVRILLRDREPPDTLWICSAYTSLNGVRLLQRWFETAKARVIAGVNTQTEWEALDQLKRWGVDVRIMRDPPTGGIYHPKCFYGEHEQGHAWVLAGSANLTEGGLIKNTELGILVRGPSSLPVFRQTRQFFADLIEKAVPLTPTILNRYRTAQEEVRAAQEQVRAAMKEVAATTMGDLSIFDPHKALQATPQGQAIAGAMTAESFMQYIRTTRMEASYKMVILPLLLRSPEGRLKMADLARQFLGFYRLLAGQEREPERKRMKMRRALDMDLSDALRVLSDAPKDALSGSNYIRYPADRVEIDREVWAAMDEELREHARSLAIERLADYYRKHLGYIADFNRLLYDAESYQ